jgi:hypothetical protein
MSDEKLPSHPQAISKIESRVTLTGLLAPLVIALNSVGIICCIYIFFTQSSTLHKLSGADLIEEIKENFETFQQLDVDTRATADKVHFFEPTLNVKLSQRAVLEITESMQTTEKNAQLFLRLLKVNMYNLTSYMPGIAAWYEINSPAIDLAIARSRSRELKLLTIRAYYAEDA